MWKVTWVLDWTTKPFQTILKLIPFYSNHFGVPLFFSYFVPSYPDLNGLGGSGVIETKTKCIAVVPNHISCCKNETCSSCL